MIPKQPLSNIKCTPPPALKLVNGPTITSLLAVKFYFSFEKLIAFSQGIESNIKLFFNVNGALPDAFLNFQPANQDNLPTETDFYYGFHVQQGGLEMPPLKKINGIENFDEAIMILGLLNRDSSKTTLQITYSATRDSESDNDDEGSYFVKIFQKLKISLLGISLKKLVVGIIVSVGVAAVLFICIGGYSFGKPLFY